MQQLSHRPVVVTVLLLCTAIFSTAPAYSVAGTGTFDGMKTVLLLQNPQGQQPIVLFQTALRVNTDGSPLSYHPQDPRGQDKALNNVCNAIAVRRAGANENLCLNKKEFGTAIGVFEKFRDANYQVPDGFQITWQNVLVPLKDAQGRAVPCVFTSGPFKGYFGSMTALQNGLTTGKGECDINDQLNPVTVPALVLAANKKEEENVVRTFGARVGDLLVAFNPGTRRVVPAIIGDSGPPDNLGEGSIFLNMALLGATTPPTNKAETFKLSISDTQVLVAILPGTRMFQRVRPYTAENIAARVAAWQKEAGFGTGEEFVEAIKSFQPQLK